MKTPAIAPYGAYVELGDLINLRLAARKLAAPMPRARREHAGSMQSPRRGRGMDFDEVRIYQPGDDVRAIDWRVTARTTITHTKIFREEKDRAVLVLVDQRRSMFLGSRRCCKSVTAAYLAALVAWSSQQRGDQVGGVVLGEHGRRELRPSGSHSGVLHLLGEVHAANRRLDAQMTSDAALPLSATLRDVSQAMHPGNTLFLISDFHDWDRDCSMCLRRIARHCEVSALHISDVIERRLPESGVMQFSDGRSRLRVAATREARQRYAERWDKKQADLAARLTRLRIRFLSVDTADDPLSAIAAALRPRIRA